LATRAGGREIPGRLSFSLDWAAVLPPIALAGLVLATRIPLRTRYLLNWDAVQFALGVSHFDVVHHQPHPPGYLVYILAGRLLLPIFGDANSALIALSIAGECAGVVIAFCFARELFGVWAGWVAASALAVAPLFWYYGEAANTYALEPATAMLAGWACWRLWRGNGAAAIPAGVALGLAGAVRPSTAVFLMPLLLVSLRRGASLRGALLCLAAAAAVTLVWVLPMIRLSGGFVAYAVASLELGESVSGATAIWSTGLNGLITITGPAVVRGIVWELGVFAIVFVFGLVVAPRVVRTPSLPAGWLGFVALWTAPALLTFLFVHIGQVVYVQVFVPALVLSLGPALRNTALTLGRPSVAPALLALCLLANVALFLLPPRYSLAAQLQLHDRRVEELVRLVGQTDPSTTVLITDANAVGAYREAQMYLPEYHRIAFADDTHGRLGEIFADTYEPWRLSRSQPPVFPPGAGTYVFIDSQIVTRFVADPERLHVERLPDGSKIYLWTGSAPQVRSGEIWLGPRYEPVRGYR
jgi:hypothetical protein